MRLFHLSEEENIVAFVPRKSKQQWDNKKYVWAIGEDKIRNYLLPRDCPRICIGIEMKTLVQEWVSLEKLKEKKSIIFVPEVWQREIENCTLYKYEFDGAGFKEIDRIASYYVSDKTEIPINKSVVNNCLEELKFLNVMVVMTDVETLGAIKEKIIQHTNEFSIIRWSNLEK